MDHPLDKLFRSKLDDYAPVPPSPAWQRVEAGLPKKNKGAILLRVAAGILLLGATSAMIIWWSAKGRTTEASGIARKVEVTGKTDKPDVKPQITRIAPVVSSPSRQRKLNKVQKDSKAPAATEVPVLESQQAVANPEPVVIPETQVAAVEPNPAKKNDKPVVIEYRLETVATAPALKDKSNLRKVIDFAIDAKNSSPLGDLREAKDDLFALNFKNRKKDKQDL